MTAKPNFEKFLLETKLVTEEALKAAAANATARHVSLVESLAESGVVGQDELAAALAKFHGVEFQAGPLALNRELLAQFPAFTLRRFRVIPLFKKGQNIVVASSSPGNLMATDEIRRISKLSVVVVCTTEKAITEALQAMSGESPAAGDAAKARPVETESAQIQVNSNTAAHIDRLLQMSVARAASDIHFEPQTSYAIVRERVDGILYEVERLSVEGFAPVLSRLKLLAGMDIVEKRLAQDGRFRYEFNGGHCEIRGSTLPTIYGEKMVLRLLRSDKSDPNLNMLDIGETRMARIREVCGLHDGLVVVAGPTGCGKTTTIYAVLSELDRKSQNLITIEDPVEYEMEMANQVQINPKIGVTFASILPFILRQDPDVLMVGEIRDEETAQMVMRAAISGHLVFSTIHAPSALQSIARLLNMGVEPHMIVASLKASISQRLLRKLCPHCKKARPMTAEDKRILGAGVDDKVKVYEAKGCEQCHQLGYAGRFAAMEVLLVSDQVREVILKNDLKALELAAREGGFRSIRDHAIERIIQGETSITEMIAHCG